jgi:hypothetical protein
MPARNKDAMLLKKLKREEQEAKGKEEVRIWEQLASTELCIYKQPQTRSKFKVSFPNSVWLFLILSHLS